MNHNSELSPLTSAEQQALAKCESIFWQGAAAPFEMGRALQEIRDRRLYREQYCRFAKYCRQKLDCSRSHADRLIGAWRVQALLTPIGVTLENEYQPRPLMSLSDEQVKAAGRHVIQNCSGRKITAEDFKRAAEIVRPPKRSARKPVKPAKLSATAVAKAQRLLTLAEKASELDDKSALQKAFAELRACLAGADPKPQEKPAELPAEKPAENNESPAAEVVSQTPVTAESAEPTDNPAEILMGQTVSPISKWNEVLLFIANWVLQKQSTLPPEITFIKRDRSQFPSSARLRPLQDGSFLDIRDDCKTLKKKARRLLDTCGHSDLKLSVRLNSGQTIDL